MLRAENNTQYLIEKKITGIEKDRKKNQITQHHPI